MFKTNNQSCTCGHCNFLQRIYSGNYLSVLDLTNIGLGHIRNLTQFFLDKLFSRSTRRISLDRLSITSFSVFFALSIFFSPESEAGFLRLFICSKIELKSLSLTTAPPFSMLSITYFCAKYADLLYLTYFAVFSSILLKITYPSKFFNRIVIYNIFILSYIELH